MLPKNWIRQGPNGSPSQNVLKSYLKKVPGLCHIGPIWPTLGANLTSLGRGTATKPLSSGGDVFNWQKMPSKWQQRNDVRCLNSNLIFVTLICLLFVCYLSEICLYFDCSLSKLLKHFLLSLIFYICCFFYCNTTRVVHNPAFLIPLVEKNGNPATFAVIHAIFENSGKK